MPCSPSTWPSPVLSSIADLLSDDRSTLLAFAQASRDCNDAARSILFRHLTKVVTIDNVGVLGSLRGTAAASVRHLTLRSDTATYSLRLEAALTSDLLSIIGTGRFPSLHHLSAHELRSFGTLFAAFPPSSTVGDGLRCLDVGVHEHNLHAWDWLGSLSALDKVKLWCGKWTTNAVTKLDGHLARASSVKGGRRRALRVVLRLSTASVLSLGDRLGRTMRTFLPDVKDVEVHLHSAVEGNAARLAISSSLRTFRLLSRLESVCVVLEKNDLDRSDEGEDIDGDAEDMESSSTDPLHLLSPAWVRSQVSSSVFGGTSWYPSLTRIQLIVIDYDVLTLDGDEVVDLPDAIWQHLVIHIHPGARVGDGTARVVRDDVVIDAVDVREGTMEDVRGWWAGGSEAQGV